MTTPERYRLIEGDCRDGMRTLPEASVQMCVTSPPYWGLRDYGVAGQLGLESTPEAYVAAMVEVFREVWRVLKDDGTLWLNLGDSYASTWSCGRRNAVGAGACDYGSRVNRAVGGIKEKDIVGIPWMVAFALRADGWYLRSDIIWAKPNCMPESVTDRPTRSHEYLFLLTKKPKYYYDAEAIKERCSENTHARLAQDVQNQIGSARANGGAKTNGNMKAVARKSWRGSEFHDGKNALVHPNVGKNRIKDNLSMDSALAIMPEYRNKRSVWTVSPASYKDAHFATFPEDLIRPCVLAGSKPGDVILDPFGGSGTTGQVAIELGRQAVLCELNPQYAQLIHQRCNVTPGLPI
jgi:DNA modification methylase